MIENTSREQIFALSFEKRVLDFRIGLGILISVGRLLPSRGQHIHLLLHPVLENH